MTARVKFVSASVASLLLITSAYAAEPSSASGPGWTWPPFIILPLLATAALYFLGMAKMFRGRARASIRPWAVLSFFAGWLFLLVALDSPIHELGEQLFWVHMSQHEIMMLISAPLLVLARPLISFVWAIPDSWRGPLANLAKWRLTTRLWNFGTLPFIAWLLHALALWVWHAPLLFDATLSSDFMHAMQHISFFGSALLFWWALIYGHRGKLGYGGALLYVFTTAVHTSILGALLTFSSREWYSPYLSTAPSWHLTALEDQQLGGLIMWIPAGTLLLLVSLLLLLKWISESDRRWQHTRAAAVLNRSAEGRKDLLPPASPPMQSPTLRENLGVASRLLLMGVSVSMLALTACSNTSRDLARQARLWTGGGNADFGKTEIRKYGCETCHTIPGVAGARGLVGPPLTGIGNRTYIAGELPNTPANLMTWIQHPHAVEPHTVMPEMGVTENDSRDIAAYLYTLR